MTVLACAAVVGSVIGLGPHAEADDAEDLLAQARHAATSREYTGVVQVEWRAGGTWHVERVEVTSVSGTLRVGTGSVTVYGHDDRRVVARRAGPVLQWSASSRRPAPDVGTKWDLEVEPGPPVAGRPTTVVVAFRPGSARPVARFAFDRQTGLLLRREILDREGTVVRSVAFVHLSEAGSAAQAPTVPHAQAAARTSMPALPPGFIDPERVPVGYSLLGRYDLGRGVVQLYYSDGLFAVSVFEQRGDLDWARLPRGGMPTRFGDRHAVRYVTASGAVVVWEQDGVTYTTVSDAPAVELATFVRRFSARAHRAKDHGGNPLTDIADFLLGPFGWR